jgi:hypothetical protein
MSTAEEERSTALAVALQVCRCSWHLLRWPALTFLIVIEPMVRIMLASLALLGTLTALMLGCVLRLPQFPFWWMLGCSLC